MKQNLANKLIGIGFILVLWTLMHLMIQTAAIPSPVKTVLSLYDQLKNGLLIDLLYSLYRVMVALFFSSLLGTALGIAMGLSPKMDQIISPIVYILYPLPKIAFLPILMILFGLKETSKILLIVLIIIFQFILSSKQAIDGIPSNLVISMTSLKQSKIMHLKNLYIPAVLPSFFTSLRVSFGISISILFFGENFATTYGMGYRIMNAWAMANYTQMFAGILLLSLVGLVVYGLIDIIQKRACKWMYITYNK